MSEFLSRIKARLEGGSQHASPEAGWVRGALAKMQSEPAADSPTEGHEELAGDDLANAALSTRDVAASIDDLEGAQAAAQFWSTGSLETAIPDGFFLWTPSEDVRARHPVLPPLKDLCGLYEDPGGSSVIVVSSKVDRTLSAFHTFARQLVKGLEADAILQVKKLAEAVVDFFGGPSIEVLSKTSPSGEQGSSMKVEVSLLCGFKFGSCRPRALLFKSLCDVTGLQCRLTMGFQDGKLPSSPVTIQPNEHLSNVVRVEGIDILVDLLRRPGHFRPFTSQSLLAYHIHSRAGDSDSGDYDSCDSPLEPNSPLFGSDKLGNDSPEREAESPRLKGVSLSLSNSQSAPHLIPERSADRPPLGEAALSSGRGDTGQPSLDGARSWRRVASFNSADYEARATQRRRHRARPSDGGMASSLSLASPEHPALRRFQKKAMGEEFSGGPSSPECAPQGYPSTLGEPRRSNSIEAGSSNALSSEGGPMALFPIPRRRSSRRRSQGRQDGPPSRESIESLDQSPRRSGMDRGGWEGAPPPRPAVDSGVGPSGAEGSGRGLTTMRSYEPRRSDGSASPARSFGLKELPRQLSRPRNASFGSAGSSGDVPPRPGQSPSSDQRKFSRRSVPEVSDEVVRAVRAMNEKMKADRRQSERDPGTVSSTVLGPSRDTEVGADKDAKPGECMWCHRPTSSESVCPDCSAAYAARFERLNLSQEARVSGSEDDFGSPLRAGAHAKALLRHPSLEYEAGPSCSTGSTTSAADNCSAAALATTPRRSMSDCLALLSSRQLLPYPEWHVDFQELRIGVRVGVGSFGEVFRGIWRGTEVAIKVLLEQDLNPENTEDFANEISILARLRHPNVILFLGACIKPPHLSMVSEYMHMGSLYRIIHTSGQGAKLSWRRRLKMLREICRGMMCVQRMNIVHRDLKSANCLVDKHWAVKVCDFGLSRLAAEAQIPGKTAVGTPEWMAPELLRNEPVTYKCDVFSFGVIMWELCTLKRPWEGYKPVEIVYAVAKDKARLETPPGLLGKLVEDCFAENPDERPDYEEILTRLHECEFLQEGEIA